MIVVYNFAVILAITLGMPLFFPYLLISVKRRRSFVKRLGFQSVRELKRAENPPASCHKPVWIHALSVGEMLAALPLIHQLRRYQPNVPIVFSASTVSGFENAEKLMGDQVEQVIYFPHDLQFSVHRMVTRINPGVMVIMESDVWPNFVSKMKRLDIPMIFANAKISDRSYKTFNRFPWLARLLFSKFAKICAQSREDAHRFRQLGVPAASIIHTGNVKFDQETEDLSAAELARLKEEITPLSDQRVWVAGSTHAGEEELICMAFAKVKKAVGDLLLVVAPREPKRAREAGLVFARKGFSVRNLSEIETASRKGDSHKGNPPEVIIVDSIGKLRRLYALADVALVGGSLLDIRGIGGHNPLEPAAFSKPVVFGPNMRNFKEITRLFIETGGCIQVKSAEDLSRAVVDLLTDRTHAARVGKRAFSVFRANKGAVERTFRVLQEYVTGSLERPQPSPDHP
jgi:3-deoxy-D-manno-octulosonic-acid transferase